MKQKLLKTLRLRLCAFVALVLCATGSAWGEKITDYANIVSGKQYYIGATTGNTDYYLSVDGTSLSSSIAGTAVTSQASATPFTFTGSGTSWTIQFESGYYLSLKSSKDNGKVQVVEDAATFTASNQSSKIRLTIGSYSIQKNNSGTQFGSYGNTQTDLWLEEAVTSPAYSITAQSNNTSYGTVAVSGTTITATPETGYRVSTTIPYTVTSGTATVTQEGNLFYVTASSDCTITINFEAQPTISGYTIDFESDLDCYVDWTFENIGTSNTAISAHDGSKYGANINASGNGVTSCSIQTAETIALPGTFTCYVSKVSNNTTTSTWTLAVSTDGTNWTDVATQAAQSMTKGEWVEFTANLESYSDVYVRLSYGSNNAIRAVDDISITMRDPNAKITPTVTIDATGLTNDLANSTNVNAGTIAATVSSGETTITAPAVTWSSSNTSVATVNASTGAVTLLAVGTTNLIASFAGNDDYNEASASYEFIVIDSYVKGGENNPYTVAEAIDATPSSGTSGNVYIHGIVSAFYTTSIVGDGNNHRYYVSDDGTTTTQLLVYKGNGLNNNAFTNADDLLVGDEIVICGKLTMYQSAPEVASGNYIVTLVRPQSTEPSITVAETSVNATADGGDGTIDITYANLTISSMDDFGVQFYDAENEELNDVPDWIEVLVAEQDPNIGTGYLVSYIIDANDGEARTAYFKVFASGDADYVYSDLVTVTQAAYAAPSTEGTITFGNSGTKINSASVTGDDSMGNTWTITTEGTTSFTQNTWSQVGSSNSPATSITFTTTLPAESTITSFEAKFGGYSNTAGDITLKVGDTTVGTGSLNGTADVIVESTSAATGTILTITVNNIAKGVKCYYISYEVAETVPVTISAAGYSTLYYGTKNLVVPESMEAYTVKVTTKVERSKTYNVGDVIPAGTAVVLKAEQGQYAFNVTTDSGETDTNNALKGTDEAAPTTGGEYYYALTLNAASEAGSVGFYWMAENGAAFTCGAHKAYLALENTFADLASGGVKSFYTLSDIEDGIKDLDVNLNHNAEIFNLAGQRLQKAQRGINIINGKKVVIK